MSRPAAVWDFALRIRGVTPESLPMARLAEYLKAWAALIGDENEPHFAGIVKGSAVMRASVGRGHRMATRLRIAGAGQQGEADAVATPYGVLAEMMERDQVTGEVRDRKGAVILEFKRPSAVESPRVVVQDTSVVDGVVISLAGADDTVHLRLQDVDSQIYRITLRDLSTARQLAAHFRSGPIRAHVHGSWERTGDGRWQPLSLYLDRFEELDDEPAAAILNRLSALPGNRWTTMEDPEQELRRLRGDD